MKKAEKKSANTQEVSIPYPKANLGTETCEEFHKRVKASGFSPENLTQRDQKFYCTGGGCRNMSKHTIVR